VVCLGGGAHLSQVRCSDPTLTHLGLFRLEPLLDTHGEIALLALTTAGEMPQAAIDELSSTIGRLPEVDLSSPLRLPRSHAALLWARPP
jgi:hypothetical protein